MSILQKLGLKSEVMASITEAGMLDGRNTTTLRRGVRTPYDASFNGFKIPSYVTLKSGRLTEMRLINHYQVADNNRHSWLVEGIMMDVKLDVEVIFDGVTYSLPEFMRQMNIEASGKDISETEFNHYLRRIGFKFDEGMPLFFQHFGANENSFNEVANLMIDNGGSNTSAKFKKYERLEKAFSHPGIPVTEIEISSADRSKSTRNQGFLNLVDAQIDQLNRIMSHRKAAAVFQQQAEEGSLNGMTQTQIKALQEKAKIENDLAGMWRASWGGAQKRLIQEKGKLIEDNLYDPTKIRTGRFMLALDGQSVPVDLWTNKSTANTSGTATTVATPDVDDDDVF